MFCKFWPCLPALVLCVALQAHAAIYKRCTQVQEGKVFSGEEINEEPVELSAGERRYIITLDVQQDCETGLVVTVCDLLPPEVIVSDDLDSVRVLRTGPMWLQPTLEVTRFCTRVVTSPIMSTATPSPDAPFPVVQTR